MSDDEILRRALEGECCDDGSTLRVLVAEVRRLKAELAASVKPGSEPSPYARKEGETIEQYSQRLNREAMYRLYG